MKMMIKTVALVSASATIAANDDVEANAMSHGTPAEAGPGIYRMLCEIEQAAGILAGEEAAPLPASATSY
jgi:hypothetical protein